MAVHIKELPFRFFVFGSLLSGSLGGYRDEAAHEGQG